MWRDLEEIRLSEISTDRQTVHELTYIHGMFMKSQISGTENSKSSISAWG